MGLEELKAKIQFETRVIKEVKKREVLYNSAYSGKEFDALRVEEWQNISDVLGESAPALKSRWRNLHDRFQQIWLLHKNANATTSSTNSRWVHYDGMSFLTSHQVEPKTELVVRIVPSPTPKVHQYNNSNEIFDNGEDEAANDNFNDSQAHKSDENTMSESSLFESSDDMSSVTSRKRKHQKNFREELEQLLAKATDLVETATIVREDPAEVGTKKFFASLADKVLAAKLSTAEQMQLERETLDFVYTKLQKVTSGQINGASGS